MPWLELITLLALLQFAVFGGLVGRARGMYGVKAPAVAGDEMFERYYRVQMNTLEQLVLFLPALWLAAGHLDHRWVAGLGVVYLLGRIVYFRSYIADPAKRGMGFGLTFFPTVILIFVALIGVAWDLISA